MNHTKSKRLNLIKNDIRGTVYHQALRLEQSGRSILKLNTGNPAAFDFKMPDEIRAVLCDKAEEATAYCSVQGMEAARAAVLSYHKDRGIEEIGLDDVFLSNGVSEMVQVALLSLLDPDDEILLPTPCYSLWENCAYLACARPVFYRCQEENAWLPDVEHIRSLVGARTRAIVLINPNNPSGAVYPPEKVREILDVARAHRLVVFSDEIYDRLLLSETPFVSTAALCPDLVCMTFNGLSKSHVICGLRSGWAVVSGPRKEREEFKEALFRLCAMRLCPNTLSQLVVPAAPSHKEYTDSILLPKLKERRKVVLEAIARIDGLDCIPNQAAFYLFPRLDKRRFGIESDTRFALDLLNAKGILVVPGSGFAMEGNAHFRIVMLPSEEILSKAMEDLGDFLSDYKQK